jgi:hypothetical protein
MVALVALAIAPAGCGTPPEDSSDATGANDDGRGAAAAARGPVAATAEGASDAVVAKVNGLPVYASCVAHQAKAMQARPRGDAPAGAPALQRRALEECIGFELLAQEAAARGLAAAPEVAEAARRAAVNRFIEREIDDKVRTAAELPPSFSAQVLQRNRWRLHRVDYRASSFVRFKVAESEPEGSPADRAARAAAERVAAALAGERGLFPAHLIETARRLAPDQAVEEGNAPLSDAERLVPAYSQALFALPEIGRTTAALRTQWGWDVVLWTEQLPPRDLSERELADELFPDSRLAYFNAWSKAQSRGVSVQVNPQAAELLARAAAEDVQGDGPRAPAAPTAPAAPPSPSPAPPPTPAPQGRP